MASTVKRGNYYKNKTKKWYEDHGYTVELTEFVCGRQIAPGKIIYQKKDILASDGIAYNKDEFILWNSKYAVGKESFASVKYQGKEEYKKIKVPKFIKKKLIIWIPRKKIPEVIEL